MEHNYLWYFINDLETIDFVNVKFIVIKAIIYKM